MNKISQSLLTTGEFARLAGTTKDTLFHYDAIKVFTPAYIGANGYRYYSPGQLDVFYVIDTLKELDMPLQEIKEYLDRRSPEELVNLLEKEESKIERKLQKLNRMKALIHRKAELTREVIGLDPDKMIIRQTEEQYLLCTPSLPLTTPRNLMLSLSEHFRCLDEHNIISPYSVGALYDPAFQTEEFCEGYTHMYTRIEHPLKNAPVHIRPEGKYLTLYHAAGYNNIQDGYTRLWNFIKKHRLHIKGCVYEDILLDELSVKGYDNYLLQLSILVD